MRGASHETVIAVTRAQLPGLHQKRSLVGWWLFSSRCHFWARLIARNIAGREAKIACGIIRAGERGIAMSEAVVAGHICLDVFPALSGAIGPFTPGQIYHSGERQELC